MNKRIVFKNPDGTCGIIIPSPKAAIDEEFTNKITEEFQEEIDGKIVTSVREKFIKNIVTRKMTIEEIATKDVPPGLSWRIVDIENLPEDRTFRDAWTDENPTETVDICMEKARKIQEESIRQERNKKLPQTDIELLKAIETHLSETLPESHPVKEVINKRQTLRDLPKNTDLSKAETPEELQSVWPEELK